MNRDGSGRTAMWQAWADKHPIPPWRQDAEQPQERRRFEVVKDEEKRRR